ncbi:unnamed protein product [Rangifer tarandus platyrhynchus]|uniref:Uncharacterized protein n=1 Tax=Rangifer tarandus platyrhynchus TaxID=3082113 RepID=A0ABN9A5F6_RANTA|nr:unnamed protein product [Rangifer tarandus platyrhynchus]
MNKKVTAGEVCSTDKRQVEYMGRRTIGYCSVSFPTQIMETHRWTWFVISAMSAKQEWTTVYQRAQDLEHQGFHSCGVQLRCFVESGIFPDQGTRPHVMHWQADSQPMNHLGSP